MLDEYIEFLNAEYPVLIKTHGLSMRGAPMPLELRMQFSRRGQSRDAISHYENRQGQTRYIATYSQVLSLEDAQNLRDEIVNGPTKFYYQVTPEEIIISTTAGPRQLDTISAQHVAQSSAKIVYAASSLANAGTEMKKLRQLLGDNVPIKIIINDQ